MSLGELIKVSTIPEMSAMFPGDKTNPRNSFFFHAIWYEPANRRPGSVG
jgi:hypothetical protein